MDMLATSGGSLSLSFLMYCRSEQKRLQIDQIHIDPCTNTPCILYLVQENWNTCFGETFKVSTVQFKVSKKHKGYFNAFIVLDNLELLMIDFGSSIDEGTLVFTCNQDKIAPK